MTTAIYARISRDRAGTMQGEQRQIEDAEALIQRQGLPSALPPYIDNDKSAYSGKPRPAYQRLIQDMRDGIITDLVIWHPDRLHRSPVELESFIDVVNATGVNVWTCTAGTYDLTTPDGRLSARIVGAVARKESEDKSRRITRKHLATAQDGGYHGGRRRFGYTAGMEDVEPDEAEAIRDACKRIIAGDSLHRIAKDWADAGITGPSGATFTGPNLRAMLMGAHHVKVRVHNAKDRKGNRERGITTSTQMIPATWPAPAILDREDWEAMRSILTDPSRRTNGSPARIHAYTGIARCGVCGGPMRCRQDGKPGKKRLAYICGNGSHAQRLKDVVHDVVSRKVAAYVHTHRVSIAPVQDDGEEQRQARADALIQRKQDLAAMLGDVDAPLDVNAYAIAVARIDADLAAIMSERVETTRPSLVLASLLEAGDYDTTRDVFDGMTIDRQREVIAAIGATIIIDPSRVRGGRLDDDGIRLEVHPPTAT